MDLNKFLLDGMSAPLPASKTFYEENYYMSLTIGHYNLNDICMALVVNNLFVQAQAQNKGAVSLIILMLIKALRQVGVDALVIDLSKFKLTALDMAEVETFLFDKGFTDFKDSTGHVFKVKHVGQGNILAG